MLNAVRRWFKTGVYCSLLAIFVAITSAHAGKTLEAVQARDMLRCGVNTGLAGFALADSKGKWHGLDVDFCRAVAAAVLGDPKKIEYIPLSSQQRFLALQSGEVDLLSRNTTWTLSRDASLGLSFVGVIFYDGQGFLVPKRFKLKNAKALSGAEICVVSGTTTELNVADYFRAKGLRFKPVVFDSYPESKTAFFNGRCQAYTADRSALAAILSADTPKPQDYEILPDVISKEPLAPAVRLGDDEWFAIVKWVLYALIQAEEKGINSANVIKMKKSRDPVVQRLLGVTGDFGKKLGLRNDWALQAIKAVGHYGQIYARNITPLGLKRAGQNSLWREGGLMYAMPVR